MRKRKYKKVTVLGVKTHVKIEKDPNRPRIAPCGSVFRSAKDYDRNREKKNLRREIEEGTR